MYVTGPHHHPISWHKLIDQQESKKKQRKFPLNIISVMCKERSKSASKYLQIWMYNLQTRSFVLPNASGCIFSSIQIWFAECKWF